MTPLPVPHPVYSSTLPMSDPITNEHQHKASVSYLVSWGSDGTKVFKIRVLKPSAVCLSEDLKTKWDEKERKWVLYRSEVEEDTTFYHEEVGSLKTTKDIYELTIVAEDNYTVSISREKNDFPGLPQFLRALK